MRATPILSVRGGVRICGRGGALFASSGRPCRAAVALGGVLPPSSPPRRPAVLLRLCHRAGARLLPASARRTAPASPCLGRFPSSRGRLRSGRLSVPAVLEQERPVPLLHPQPPPPWRAGPGRTPAPSSPGATPVVWPLVPQPSPRRRRPRRRGRLLRGPPPPASRPRPGTGSVRRRAATRSQSDAISDQAREVRAPARLPRPPRPAEGLRPRVHRLALPVLVLEHR